MKKLAIFILAALCLLLSACSGTAHSKKVAVYCFYTPDAHEQFVLEQMEKTLSESEDVASFSIFYEAQDLALQPDTYKKDSLAAFELFLKQERPEVLFILSAGEIEDEAIAKKAKTVKGLSLIFWGTAPDMERMEMFVGSRVWYFGTGDYYMGDLAAQTALKSWKSGKLADKNGNMLLNYVEIGGYYRRFEGEGLEGDDGQAEDATAQSAELGEDETEQYTEKSLLEVLGVLPGAQSKFAHGFERSMADFGVFSSNGGTYLVNISDTTTLWQQFAAIFAETNGQTEVVLCDSTAVAELLADYIAQNSIACGIVVKNTTPALNTHIANGVVTAAVYRNPLELADILSTAALNIINKRHVVEGTGLLIGQLACVTTPATGIDADNVSIADDAYNAN